MTETTTPFCCPVCFGFDRHNTGCSYAEAQSVGSRTARLLAAESARVAELQARCARTHEELKARRNEDLGLRGLLSPNGGERAIPAEVSMCGSLVPAVSWLIARVAELEAQLDNQRWGGAHTGSTHVGGVAGVTTETVLPKEAGR